MLYQMKAEEWVLFPIYFGRRVTGVRIDLILLEIKGEYLSAVVLTDTNMKVEIVQASETQQLNWWGIGFELYQLITEENTKKMPESIELLWGKNMKCNC